MLEFEPDVVSPHVSSTVATARTLDAIGFKQLQWAGPRRRRQPALPVPRPRIHEGRRVRRVPRRPDRLLPAQVPAAHRRRLRGLEECRTCRACTISASSPACAASPSRACARRCENLLEAAEEVERLVGHTTPTSPSASRRSAIRATPAATPCRPTTSSPTTSAAPRGMMKDLFRHKDKLLQLLDKRARVPGAPDHRERQGGRASDGVHPDPLGARRVHVGRSSSRNSGGRRSAR